MDSTWNAKLLDGSCHSFDIGIFIIGAIFGYDRCSFRFLIPPRKHRSSFRCVRPNSNLGNVRRTFFDSGITVDVAREARVANRLGLVTPEDMA